MEALFDPFSFEKKGQAHIGRESGKMDQARQRGRSGCRPFNVSMPKGQDVKGGKAGYVTLRHPAPAALVGQAFRNSEDRADKIQLEILFLQERRPIMADFSRKHG